MCLILIAQQEVRFAGHRRKSKVPQAQSTKQISQQGPLILEMGLLKATMLGIYTDGTLSTTGHRHISITAHAYHHNSNLQGMLSNPTWET